VALAQVAGAFEGRDSGSEIRYRRKDGSVFWAAIFISPVRDQSGDVVQHFASFVELTKRKQQQAQSAMMINELNHRVKNALSTVQPIVWQALRTASDPEVIRESIETRLFALSRSHDLLTRENWKGAGLLDLVNEALEPFGVANGRSGSLRDHGQGYPSLAKSDLGARHCVPRTRDECGEIRCVHDMRDGHRDRPLLKKPFQSEELAKIFMRLFPWSSDNDPRQTVLLG
jgi:HWE histidine kinase